MSVSKPTVLLEHYLKQLKLPTMLREYAKLASVCQSERADYQTFLLRLSEREVHDRELRAAERRVKAAKFPVVKTLDTFDFPVQPSINQELVRELIRATPELLARRADPRHVPNSPLRCTGLHAAVQADRPTVAETLLEAGIDIEARNVEGRTALHDAIELGCGPITEMLTMGMRQGLDPPGQLNPKLVNGFGDLLIRKKHFPDPVIFGQRIGDQFVPKISNIHFVIPFAVSRLVHLAGTVAT